MKKLQRRRQQLPIKIVSIDAEFAAFEAQVELLELASQEMMAEIQAEMARQAALDAFQANLAADKAAAAKSTAAYQSKGCKRC